MNGEVVARVGTQPRVGGVRVQVGGAAVRDGVLSAHLGVAHRSAGRPAWVAVGEAVRVPGWGTLRVVDVLLAEPGRVGLDFEPEAGGA